jgi:hypothetical protein
MGKDPKTELLTLRLKNGNAVHLAARGTVTTTSCAVPVPATIDAAVASAYLETRYQYHAPSHTTASY